MCINQVLLCYCYCTYPSGWMTSLPIALYSGYMCGRRKSGPVSTVCTCTKWHHEILYTIVHEPLICSVILTSTSRLVFPTKISLPTTTLRANDEKAMKALFPHFQRLVIHLSVAAQHYGMESSPLKYWLPRKSRYRLTPFKWFKNTQMLLKSPVLRPSGR